ncbi:MAG TPA: DinB family protein [Chthonomonadales bacterium]|nr:DinB family protein [Chthonomonadales bacterium]
MTGGEAGPLRPKARLFAVARIGAILPTIVGQQQWIGELSLEDIISFCKKQATESLHYFLNTLSFVPVDKLAWSPAPTAKSALQIAAHCAGYSGAFASIIRAGKFPGTAEEFRSKVHSVIDSITTLEQAQDILRKGIADSVAALDTVKPEQVGANIATPHGETPFTFFMTLPAYHLDGHAAQIDYLQTCWDDQEVHF